MKKGWKPLACLLASILTVGTLPVSVPAAEAETIFNETEADNLNQAEDILFEPEAEGNTEEEEIPASVTYMVTLDANGGVFYDQWDDSLGGSLERAEVLTKIVPVGESVEVFPPVQESVGEGQSAFVFAGWSFSREGEAEIPEGEAFVPDADCSLYAVWQTAEAADSEAAEVEPAEVFENTDSEVLEMDQILPDSDMTEETAEESEAVEAGEEAAESDEAEAPEETEGLGAVEASAETEGLETVEASAETGAFEVEEASAETGESVETGAAAEVWESDVVEEAGEESAAEETKSGVTDQGTDEDPEDAPEAGQGAESTDDETVVSEEPDTPEVTSISLDPKEIVADINSGGFLNYSCVPDEADPPEVEWSSSNEEVVTVEDGMLTYWSAGEAVITVSVQGHPEIKDTCKVTVIALVNEIALSQTAITVNKGKTAALKIREYWPDEPTNKSVTWKSSDTTVATVDTEGTVKGVAKGTAMITATAEDGGGAQASCKVTVTVPVTKITLAKTSLILNKGAKTALKVKSVVPSDANNKTVTWKSSNTKIATVDAQGNVKAVAKGTATITATAKDGSGVKASCKVTVKVPVTKITLAKTSLILNKGAKTALKVKSIVPSDANNKAVTWKSSNTKIATVDAYGNVKAVAKGTATITATAKDGSGVKASCKVTVKVPVTKITLAKTSLILNKGVKTALKVKSVLPSNANNKAVTWKSSNTKIATVDAKGNVKAIAKGTATITATAKDGSGVKASCKVTVKVPVTKITLAKTSLILNKGVKTALKVKSVLPSNANNKAVT
ncbi:MAG: Ig-like domain-containing protein, partial [Lachnospiraceae bacterium]|nr:Ig-like domain-containing protein [Lachnospiraceae bacterium]